MNTFRRNTLLMVLVVLGIIALVVSTVVYSWLFMKVHDTIGQVASASEEVQILATKNAHTQTVRRVVRDTVTERMELDSYFISEEKLVSFLEDIEELGVHAGASLSVQSVSVGNAIDTDGLVTPLKLALKSEGTLKKVFYALALLETFPKALVIDTVRFTQHPDTLEWSGEFYMSVIQIDSLDIK